jgi:hypothetical protein
MAKGLLLALLRQKGLVCFGTEKPTLLERPEGEILTQHGRSAAVTHEVDRMARQL